jgi:DNA-binding NtrC family response regulator
MLAAEAEHLPLLIRGESGTGKGALARWIHQNGPRASRPLLESVTDQPLLPQIARAHTGTFIVRELGTLPLGEQKKLLAFLSTKSIPAAPPEVPTSQIVNVRIIGLTSFSLENRVQNGFFNADLLAAFQTHPIEMPPLYDRGEEFVEISMAIIREMARELHKDHLRAVSDEAWRKLRGYDWPGNLRELRNVLQIAVVNAKTDQIEASDLPYFGKEQTDFLASREAFERVYMGEILKTVDWNLSEAAKLLRITTQELMDRASRHGLSTVKPTDA